MPIDATDLIICTLPRGSSDEKTPVSSPHMLMPNGKAGTATLAELAAAMDIANGVATLAITDGANVAASVAGPARFQRIGSTVFVSGSLTVDPTLGAPTATQINIALPIASTLGAITELSGTIVGNGGADVGVVIGDVGTDDAQADWSASHTDVQTYLYQFSYEII